MRATRTAIADFAEARGLQVTVHGDIADAAQDARAWAATSDRRAVVVAGSVILAGEALALASAENWKAGWERMSEPRTRHADRLRDAPRGAAESLATIVLGFESVVVFLGGLAIYGLKALPAPIEQWWGIVARGRARGR